MRSEDTSGSGTRLSYAVSGSDNELLLTNYNGFTIYRGAISVTTNITATDVHLKDVSGLKQQIRLAFSFAAGATGDFVALRLLAAMWRDA